MRIVYFSMVSTTRLPSPPSSGFPRPQDLEHAQNTKFDIRNVAGLHAGRNRTMIELSRGSYPISLLRSHTDFCPK